MTDRPSQPEENEESPIEDAKGEPTLNLPIEQPTELTPTKSLQEANVLINDRLLLLIPNIELAKAKQAFKDFETVEHPVNHETLSEWCLARIIKNFLLERQVLVDQAAEAMKHSHWGGAPLSCANMIHQDRGRHPAAGISRRLYHGILPPEDEETNIAFAVPWDDEERDAPPNFPEGPMCGVISLCRECLDYDSRQAVWNDQWYDHVEDEARCPGCGNYSDTETMRREATTIVETCIREDVIEDLERGGRYPVSDYTILALHGPKLNEHRAQPGDPMVPNASLSPFSLN